MSKRTVLWMGLLVLAGLSCKKLDDLNDPSALAEVYLIKESISQDQISKRIGYSPVRPIEKITNGIKTKENLYLLEYLKGVHVFKNIPLGKPDPLCFIEIPAVYNFVISGQNLIANSGNDVINLNIEGLNNLVDTLWVKGIYDVPKLKYTEAQRVKNLVEFPNYPPERGVYFQCPDKVGFVTKWEKTVSKTKLTCYR